MALDQRRLIRLGKKKAKFYGVRQVYFAKSYQQMWVRVNQPFTGAPNKNIVQNHLNIAALLNVF